MTRPKNTDGRRSPSDSFLDRIHHLNVDRGGGQRKPHKPLLMLLAIARLLQRNERAVSFVDVERELRPLLDLYAPPVRGRHQPELPYWHLMSDRVWRVPGAEGLERTAKGFPKLAALRSTNGAIPTRFADAMLTDRRLAKRAVQQLLDEHFEASLHPDVLAGVGFAVDWLGSNDAVHQGGALGSTGRQRDRTFRDEVLAAYDHRCAVTGFQAMIGGALFGVEAAHVQWHSKGGSSSVTNGIALNPTLHKLFDHGAWTLTDDRRILVSSAFSGSDAALGMLRPHHRQCLRATVSVGQRVDVRFIRWHREADLGGVFRAPAMD